ncbi:MAG: hypothetical protein J6R18_00480 [Kiritimatiellae bacterium]|nr:hypothetical protein [Kiritimatiellia bacterium]
MNRNPYSRGQVRKCQNSLHFEQEPAPPPFTSDCKTRFAAWYKDRGYAPCPHYQDKPLTDEDYL